MKYVILALVAIAAIWYVNKGDSPLKIGPSAVDRPGASKAKWDKMSPEPNTDTKQEKTRGGSDRETNPDGTPITDDQGGQKSESGYPL